MIGALATFFAEEYVHRNIGRFSVVHGHHHHDHEHQTDGSVKHIKESSDAIKDVESGTELSPEEEKKRDVSDSLWCQGRY